MTKIAQIGCGHWGKNLARNFSEIDALGAVVDGNPETAKKMSESYGVPVTDFASALQNDSISGIALATPAETHGNLALQAIAAGKHIYVEKPLALAPNEAEQVIAAAADAGVCLMVGHLLQYHPVFIAMCKLVTDGKIGKLRYLYSNRMSLGKFRTEENVLWSFAPHDFSMILSLVNEEPDMVSAQGAAFVTSGIADWCTTQFAFPSGVRGHVQTSWLHPFKEQRLVVIGENGMLVFEDSLPEWDKKLAFYNHSIDTDGPAPVPTKADVEYIEVEQGEPLKDECRHFVHCIETGSTPRTDGTEGLRVLKALDQAEIQLQISLAGA